MVCYLEDLLFAAYYFELSKVVSSVHPLAAYSQTPVINFCQSVVQVVRSEFAYFSDHDDYLSIAFKFALLVIY